MEGLNKCPQYFHVFLFKKRLNKVYKMVSSEEYGIRLSDSPRGWFILPVDVTKGADFFDAREFVYANYQFQALEEY